MANLNSACPLMWCSQNKTLEWIWNDSGVGQLAVWVFKQGFTKSALIHQQADGLQKTLG